jgi:hypothetical protein
MTADPRCAVDRAIRGEVGRILARRSKLAASNRSAKQRRSAAVAGLVAMGLLVGGRASSAYGQESTAAVENARAAALPPESQAPPPASSNTPAPANPALDFHTQAPEQPSVFHRWWFWTAVGAAAAATVVIIVVSSRGHAPPSTDLGNQEFQP